MKHPFIVIEGLDGSGKATQTNQLCKALEQKQIKYRHLTFPDYEQDSSALIKLYLAALLEQSLTVSTPMLRHLFMR